MIHVVATIELKEGCREDFLKILNKNVPNVKTEKGCIAYEPTVNVASGLPVQGEVRENVVTIIEAWENLDAFHKHLKMPHMADYRESVKNFVRNLNIQVLKSV